MHNIIIALLEMLFNISSVSHVYHPLVPPTEFYTIKNNTDADIFCKFSLDLTEWSNDLKMEGGKEFSLPKLYEKIYILCGKPVAQVAYEIFPGKRYSFLRSDINSSIILHDIDVN